MLACVCNCKGWVKTFQQYFQEQTRFILDNMLRKLEQYPKMRFVFAEITYFSLWWNDLDIVQKESVKKWVSVYFAWQMAVITVVQVCIFV